VNELCIHSYVWIPAWTTALGRVAAERASAAGVERVVVPLSNQGVIDPGAIARIFDSYGIRPVNVKSRAPEPRSFGARIATFIPGRPGIPRC
jgi:hypothetical protein